MSWDGMLPKGTKCKQCGVELNADGGHPAELYLGTFTGLCYKCERAGPRVVARYVDGAMCISHPPHSPSWRRDREEDIAYDGCEECGGSGRTIVSRDLKYGGSYYKYCRTCSERYHSHPDRKLASELRQLAYDICYQAADIIARKRFKIPKRKKVHLAQEQLDSCKGITEALWHIKHCLDNQITRHILEPLEIKEGSDERE